MTEEVLVIFGGKVYEMRKKETEVTVDEVKDIVKDYAKQSDENYKKAGELAEMVGELSADIRILKKEIKALRTKTNALEKKI